MRARSTTACLMAMLLVAGCSDQPESPVQPEESPAQQSHVTGMNPDLNRQLAEVREATAPFNDLQKAEDAGYDLDQHCVENPTGPGAMGMHAVNWSLIGDGSVDPLQPEVLVYAPRGDGDGLELVAVEYLALAPPFTSAPSLFGETFVDHTATPHGLDPHFELHAWLWHHNPDGVFAQWNRMITCPTG